MNIGNLKMSLGNLPLVSLLLLLAILPRRFPASQCSALTGMTTLRTDF